MRNKNLKAVILIAAGTLGLCLYFAACDGKKPNEPEEPKDYVVYFSDGCVNEGYYGYHPQTGQLDSLPIPVHAALGDMAVSADGKKLYMCTDQFIGVVGLETLELVGELPYTGAVTFSPDNRLVAIQGNGLYILNTDDFSLFYEDTTRTWGGCFGRDSKRLYCCGGSASDPCVYIFDLDAGPTITKKQFSDASTMIKVMPSPDESKWFLFRYSGYQYTAFFDVYDVLADSIIFRDWLIPMAGSMTLTPDGRYLFYSIPNTIYGGDAPSYFTVFDVEKNRIRMLVSTVGFKDGFDPIYMPVGDLAMTPDGQWLIAGDGGGAYSIGAPTFLVFNIKTMAIESYVDIPRVAGLHYTCQNAP